MSRVIVKGLPKYLTEERLKDHFSKKGDITDVKLRKNNKGESRRFAFIGYRNAEDAEAAVRYFNGSFIDTSKIDVEVAKSFVDPNVPKSFKEKKREAFDRLRLREEQDLQREEEIREKKRQKLDKNFKKSKIDQEIENDPQLKEFIEATKPSTQAKSWSNDVVINENGAPSNSLLEQALALKSGDSVENKFGGNKVADEIFKINENESDDEYDDNLIKNDGSTTQDGDEEMISLDDLQQQQKTNEDEDGDANNNDHDSNDVNDEAISDLDWLKRRRIRIKENGEKPQDSSNKDHSKTSDVDESTEQSSKPVSHETVDEPKPTDEELAIQKIKETGRLFLRNISYTSSENDFRDLFSKFGELEEVHIAIDTRTGQSKGFCYIKFAENSQAIDAYIELDKQIFQGRLLHILPADGKKDHKFDEFDLKNLPLKKQRELKKKNDASKSQFSWNSLFVNNDAVLQTIASDLNVDKRDLIDPENSNSAVKQALAESHVLGDIRKFFEQKGIDLTKFQGKERDDSIILIKNIPFGTNETELLELFQPFGELKRLIIPPSGTIAIVQFRDLPTGRSAFTKLAYRRFKKSILYLEKGPKDLFTREPLENESLSGTEIPINKDIKEIVDNSKDIPDDNVETFEGATVSIFVKNLNFTTTSQQLTDLFAKLPGFVLATIKTKPDPKDSTKRLSMGFGFAEFKSKDQASAAISVVDGSVLDGHKLLLKLSHRQNTINSSSSSSSNKSKTVSSKIIVKNLPFEATRKDVFELFNSFGQLKSVRVPKKFDKSARGFAFVEFLLPKEAENAIDQLQGVHLLGRRLVIQYAEQASDDVEAEIEKLTNKAKRQAATKELGSLRASGKRKLDLDDEVDDIDNF